jgi:hypothetical protein
MTKTLTAMTAAVALAAATTLVPADANARPRGGAIAGVLTGLAAGAIIGGAIASSRGYAPYPAYAAPYPVACPGGYWARRPLYNPYGEFVGYSRPRFFCP